MFSDASDAFNVFDADCRYHSICHSKGMMLLMPMLLSSLDSCIGDLAFRSVVLLFSMVGLLGSLTPGGNI